MMGAEPAAAAFRAAAAALIAVAVVASCSSGRPAGTAPAANSTTQATAAVNGQAAASPAPEPPPTAATPTTPAAPAATTPLAPATASLAPSSTAVLRITAASPEDSGTDVTAEAGYQAPDPVAIRIPRIEVDAPMIPLGLRDDGKIEVPSEPEETGWWSGGPEPGEPGPAVILGHVDWTEGPAVFFDVRHLEAGDEIHIDREDGSTVTYVVESSERHPKDDFPANEVYGPTEQPTLRLVTCGGEFDFDVRSYRDNVIVFASLA